MDWAAGVEHLLTVDYPHAGKVVLVMDNLNTHSSASLHRALPAEKAYARGRAPGDPPHPKHEDWLNIAEIEPSCLTRQCLGRRISALNDLNATITDLRQVEWRFTTSDAGSDSGTYTAAL